MPSASAVHIESREGQLHDTLPAVTDAAAAASLSSSCVPIGGWPMDGIKGWLLVYLIGSVPVLALYAAGLSGVVL